jgi:hypothetical protein
LLIFYVDDLFITSSNHALLQTIVSTLRIEFAMTKLGQAFNVILVSSFNEHITTFFCIKTNCCFIILCKAQMLDCHPTYVPIHEGVIFEHVMDIVLVNPTPY